MIRQKALESLPTVDQQSFKFLNSFYKQAVKLANESSVGALDETKFKEMNEYLQKPLESILNLYYYQKKYDPTMSDAMAVWRVLRPLSSIFTNNLEQMYKEGGHLSVEQMKYLRQNGWPLSQVQMDTVAPNVYQSFTELFDAYHEQEYELIGTILADIAYFLDH